MGEIKILFDYDCGICTKNTVNSGYKRYPVICKHTKEKVLVCGTCFDFIKENEKFSSYEVVKK